MSIFADNIHNKTVLEKLIELNRLGEVFNKMGGYLYSNICAVEISELLNDLKKHHNVEVDWSQPCMGRIEFINLNDLINKYSNGDFYK